MTKTLRGETLNNFRNLGYLVDEIPRIYSLGLRKDELGQYLLASVYSSL
jgi:hypothetical protein